MEELLALTAVEAAPQLLGAKLVFDSPKGRVSGRIVEVEAYDQTDPASHSFKPKTARTAALFGPPGTIYIYFIYGVHYCLNVVTGRMGKGDALLIRALEPLEGIELMKQRRGTQDSKKLCNGPAKLVQALGIPATLNGGNYFSGPLRLEMGERVPAANIAAAPRIGISKATDKPWRFYITDSPFVS